MPIPRSRGAASGLMLIALGLWGGLIPFVGPMFGYVIGPDDAWNWTQARLWLEVLPAAAVVAGGALLLAATARGRGAFGATLAAAGGLWFVAGPTVSTLWNDGVVQAGAAHGSTGVRVLAWLGFFYGLGALIVLVSAWALGRLSVVSIRDTEHARTWATAAPATPRPAAASTAGAPTEPGEPEAPETITRRQRLRRQLFGRPLHH
jgi:hypothetical protein